jgi:hypothetical protein
VPHPRRKGFVVAALDLAHGSRLEQIEEAFRALKKRLELSVQDAA